MLRKLAIVFVTLLLAACTDRVNVPIVSDYPPETRTQTILIATNRGANEQGYFDDTRSDELNFLKPTVSIPLDHEPGKLKTNLRNPNPLKHFAIVEQKELGTYQGLATEIRKDLAKEQPGQRDITLFIHGYFNSYTDTVLRTAQIHQDLDLPGSTVAFSWPSAGRALGYTYDRESVLYSRDHLEKLIRNLAQVNADRFVLVAHSMGGLLLMEVLRQIEIKQPGWSRRNIDAVFMMAPDIALDVFKIQVEKINSLPQPFFIVMSDNDSALRLSKRVNNNSQRLGRETSAQDLADYPVTIIDLTDVTHGGPQTHFAAFGAGGIGEMVEDLQLADSILSANRDSALASITGTIIQAEKATEYRIAPEPDYTGAELR